MSDLGGVLEQVADAEVRVLVGVDELESQTRQVVGAVVDADEGLVDVALADELLDLLRVLGLLVGRQVDVVAAEGVGRGDGDGEGRVVHARVDVLGLALGHAHSLPLPVLQRHVVGELVDHLVHQLLELLRVVDGYLELLDVDALRGACGERHSGSQIKNILNFSIC